MCRAATFKLTHYQGLRVLAHKKTPEERQRLEENYTAAVEALRELRAAQKLEAAQEQQRFGLS
jgi:hypothetical protein